MKIETQESNYILEFIGNSFCLDLLLLEDEETDKLLKVFSRVGYGDNVDIVRDFIHNYRDAYDFDFALGTFLDDEVATIRVRDLETGDILDHFQADKCERQKGVDVYFDDEFNKFIAYDIVENDTNSSPEMMFQTSLNRVPTYRDLVLVTSDIIVADKTFKVYRPEVFLRGALLYQYEPDVLYGSTALSGEIIEEGYEIQKKK